MNHRCVQWPAVVRYDKTVSGNNAKTRAYVMANQSAPLSITSSARETSFQLAYIFQNTTSRKMEYTFTYDVKSHVGYYFNCRVRVDGLSNDSLSLVTYCIVLRRDAIEKLATCNGNFACLSVHLSRACTLSKRLPIHYTHITGLCLLLKSRLI